MATDKQLADALVEAGTVSLIELTPPHSGIAYLLGDMHDGALFLMADALTNDWRVSGKCLETICDWWLSSPLVTAELARETLKDPRAIIVAWYEARK